jgi:hypothetical protein
MVKIGRRDETDKENKKRKEKPLHTEGERSGTSYRAVLLDVHDENEEIFKIPMREYSLQ